MLLKTAKGLEQWKSVRLLGSEVYVQRTLFLSFYIVYGRIFAEIISARLILMKFRMVILVDPRKDLVKLFKNNLFVIHFVTWFVPH